MVLAPPPVLWLPASTFLAQMVPYKRIGGVLLRSDCCSIALSNPYLNLAEKVGGVMLREGRVPARSLQLLVRKAAPAEEICGWVLGEARHWEFLG